MFKKIYWVYRFLKDYITFKKLFKRQNDFRILKLWPIVWDKNDDAWHIWWVYFHQDLIAARRIFQNNPIKHVDIWSRTDWFVAHVASFREIEVLDIRPLKNTIKNIKFTQMDLMDPQEHLNNYTDSISSLCVIEHFGLGRYGDRLDINWHIKWLDSIYKILKRWWKFYFSVPIWPQRIEFNAHRVFDVTYLIGLFENKYHIDHFSYIDDIWDLHENAIMEKHSIKNNFWCNFGCGVFEMTKI